MNHVLSLAAVAWLVGVGAAQSPTIAEARKRSLRGNEAEAREIYLALAENPGTRTAAILGLSKSWENAGDTAKALAVIGDAVKKHGASAELLARRGELLFARGDWDGALSAVAEATKLDDENLAARWVRAQITRDRGDDAQADLEFRWFVRTYVARNRAGKDVRDPEELFIVACAGAENARRHNLSDQFRFILNEVLGDALKADADFWPAECQAGMLLLEKYNKAEALAAFDKALAINPRAAPALVGKGWLAMRQFDVAEADALAKRALDTRPDLVPALLLSADVAVACGEIGVALDRLKRARTINPRDEQTLGRIAGIARLYPKLAIDASLIDREVSSFNPKPGRYFFEIARQFDSRLKYDGARVAYTKALELSPWLNAARTEAGLLAMRIGDELNAKKLLDEAFRADPFHVRLSNSLKVLHHLEKYETIETEHFLIRFDPKNDAILGRVLADHLEAEFAKQAQQFQFRPSRKVLFELFSTQEMFSGRVIAQPDLHTVGASTGRVIAMSSPRAAGVKKNFNWARVMRHELTHVFTLEKTENQIPTWFTEGLAVFNEGFELSAEWLSLLADRRNKNELLTLATINSAFVRPNSPGDTALAYCQSRMYVEYLIATFGAGIVNKLLDEISQGTDTESAISSQCKLTLAEFERGYREYVNGVVKKSGAIPRESEMTLAQLEALAAKSPDDGPIAARLAEQYLRRKRNREALEFANAALAKDPNSGPALIVKAQMRIDAGDDEGALVFLERATNGTSPYPPGFRMLGRIYHQAGRFDEAIALFQTGRKLQPADPNWLGEIARTAKQAGDVEKSIQATMDMLSNNPDELDQRRELAQTLLEQERFAEAERFAREAIEIDAADTGAQELLIDALQKQGKKVDRIKWKRVFGFPGE